MSRKSCKFYPSHPASMKYLGLDAAGDVIGGPVRSQSRPKSMTDYLEQLFNKRGSTRENALSAIVECLTTKLEFEFVQNKFATMLYRFLNCIKKGSAKEIKIASHAIGLLALTNDCKDNAHEIYEESLPVLTEILKSKSKTSTVLDCLAIMTFFCARNAEETEKTMQVIWELIQSESGSDVTTSKPSAAFLVDAISAWSFLLTSIDGWRLSYKKWQGAISYFSNQLEQDDESICIAAGEALALIFETDSIDKFLSEANGCTDTPTPERTKSPEKYSVKKELARGSLLSQLEQLSINANSKTSAKQNFTKVSNADWEVLKFFENGNYCRTHMTISGHCLKLSSWSQKIQLNFIRRFLGEHGFVKHMLENELVQNVFEFKPSKKNVSEKELYVSTTEKVMIHYFLREGRDPTYLTKEERKQDRVLKSSIASKARTQLMNKHRKLAELRDNDHYTMQR